MTGLLLGALIGLFAGSLAGLFGIGGGIVMIPLLGLLLGLPQRQAQGVTLAVMLLPLGLPALHTYRRRGVSIPWRLVAWLVTGFLPGVWAGAQGAQRIPDGGLRIGFAAFLGVVALRLWHSRVTPQVATGVRRPFGVPGLLVGLAGGLASGLLGIGGGLVVIPLLMTLLGLGQLQAQATSLALLLLPIGLPGVWVYARSGEGLPWLVFAGVAAGFGTGGVLGAHVATRLHPERLKRAFALFLVVMGVLLVLRAR